MMANFIFPITVIEQISVTFLMASLLGCRLPQVHEDLTQIPSQASQLWQCLSKDPITNSKMKRSKLPSPQ